jgi:S-formylglutathione hydrolase FrmB
VSRDIRIREHVVGETDHMTERSGALRHRLSRRGFLAAGGATVLAAAGYALDHDVLPGRPFVYRHLGLDGPDGVVPSVEPGRTISGSFVSPARGGRRTGWSIAWPPGKKAGAALPVAVVLHGRGNSHVSAFSPEYLGLDRFLAASVGQGATPFAMASVDGGESYWHPRASGDDAGAMVLEEFLPLLRDHGLDVGRVALFGWSMGGYGALRLAGLLGRRRVVAVTALSPALWHTFEDSSPGAFDSAADFDRSMLFGRQQDLGGIPVRIDCGEEDPFYAATQDYVEGFRVPPDGGFEPGSHDVGYWRRMAPAHVRFIAEAFAAR